MPPCRGEALMSLGNCHGNPDDGGDDDWWPE